MSYGTIQNDFRGRAHWGKTTVPHADQKNDKNGHGTHCAATAAGENYGVAKEANIIAVKIFDDRGKGSAIDIAEGMRYVLTRSQSSKRPSVASMSICGLPNDLVDDGVALLTAAGVHVVAAGNHGIDARDISPARAPGAITVGATNVLDQRAIFSNYGPVLDIFAPGVDIMSAWIGNPKVC
ncbi:hypothetical protein H2248_007938 [Termitomyces sp. 'cryptogamus']|nr:hypothetical protein H2248_007938 [Termitomyces sp. 'cryptogamus']